MKSPAPITDAKQALAARGFGTFKNWQKENRKAAAMFRQRLNSDTHARGLLEALDNEYETLIRPNV